MNTKQELIQAIAANMHTSQRDAARALEAVTTAVTGLLDKDGEAKLHGLGTFRVQGTHARTGTNFHTGEKIEIPAGKRIAFKAETRLKGMVQ